MRILVLSIKKNTQSSPMFLVQLISLQVFFLIHWYSKCNRWRRSSDVIVMPQFCHHLPHRAYRWGFCDLGVGKFPWIVYGSDNDRFVWISAAPDHTGELDDVRRAVWWFASWAGWPQSQRYWNVFVFVGTWLRLLFAGVVSSSFAPATTAPVDFKVDPGLVVRLLSIISGEIFYS